jgi:hypothetical protein
MLVQLPLASDSDMYELWHTPSKQLHPALFAGIYEQGRGAHAEVLQTLE